MGFLFGALYPLINNSVKYAQAPKELSGAATGLRQKEIDERLSRVPAYAVPPRALARDACSTGARRPLPVARRGCTRASAGARRVLACLAERAARDARRAGHR